MVRDVAGHKCKATASNLAAFTPADEAYLCSRCCGSLLSWRTAHSVVGVSASVDRKEAALPLPACQWDDGGTASLQSHACASSALARTDFVLLPPSASLIVALRVKQMCPSQTT